MLWPDSQTEPVAIGHKHCHKSGAIHGSTYALDIEPLQQSELDVSPEVLHALSNNQTISETRLNALKPVVWQDKGVSTCHAMPAAAGTLPALNL